MTGIIGNPKRLLNSDSKEDFTARIKDLEDHNAIKNITLIQHKNKVINLVKIEYTVDGITYTHMEVDSVKIRALLALIDSKENVEPIKK